MSIRSYIFKKALNFIYKSNPGSIEQWASETLINESNHSDLPLQEKIDIGCQCPNCRYQRNVEKEWIDRHIIG